MIMYLRRLSPSRLVHGNLAGGTAVYTLAAILNKGLAFLLLPVMTRYLSPADYGIVAMFTVLVGLMRPFVGAMSHAAINRQYFEKTREALRSYVAGCLAILPISFALVSILVFLFSAQIEKLTQFPATWLWVVVATSTGLFFTNVQLTLWQVRMKPLPYATMEVGSLLATLGLSLALVVGMGLTWKGRILGQLVPSVGSGMLCLFLLWRQGCITARIHAADLRHALAFSLPLIPHILGMWAIGMTDRLLIVNMVGLDAAGIYAVGASVATLMYFIIDSFIKAWIPWCFSQLKQGSSETKQRIVRLIYIFDACMIALFLAFSLLVPRVLALIVGKAFSGSGQYISWLALGYAMNGMYKMRCAFLFYSQKTRWLPLVTCGTALANVGFSIILIRRFGAIGAAQGTAAAYAMSFLATWALVQRIFPMPWLRCFFKAESNKDVS